MVGQLSWLSAERRSSRSHSLKCCTPRNQTVSFVILEHRALGCMVQKHWGSLRELEFARAYEIWVMLILLIWASLCTTILYPSTLDSIFEIFLDIWQFTCFHFRDVLLTGCMITNLSCSIFSTIEKMQSTYAQWELSRFYPLKKFWLYQLGLVWRSAEFSLHLSLGYCGAWAEFTRLN